MWTVAYQASPSMELSRQEYWGGLPFSSPGDLPNPGIEPGSPEHLLHCKQILLPLSHMVPGKRFSLLTYRDILVAIFQTQLSRLIQML